MKFLLGTKEAMTQLFDEGGKVVPVTVVAVPANTVSLVRTAERDGYTALQLGVTPVGRKKAVRREVRMSEAAEVGASFDVGIFAPGDVVRASGLSKGRGFQGVVKRHGFAGGPRTHGQKHSEREPGSIGGGLRTRVPKGMRMAGRMGGERVSVRNLKIVAVDRDENKLYIGGAIPGRRGTLIEVYAS